MSAALAEVKRALGEDAVILHTRTVERRAALGIGRRRVVEVIAASANLDLPDRKPAVMFPANGRAQPRSTVLVEGAAENMPAVMDDATHREVRMLRREIDALKKLVADRVPAASATPVRPARTIAATPLSILESAVARDIAEELSARLAGALSDAELADANVVRARLADFIARMLPACGGLELPAGGATRTVALVGPAGAGKTTTVAKLAAEGVLRRGWRVGVVTLDSRRAGAVEQLRACAEILEVPMRVAHDACSLRAALADLGDCALVLIDTPGCNPRDTGSLRELHGWLSAAGDCQMHLVLPASGSRAALGHAAEAFSKIGCDRVVVTRLDEVVGCGILLECLRQVRLPISYLAHGQNIAADLAVAAPGELARQVLSGRPMAPAGVSA